MRLCGLRIPIPTRCPRWSSGHPQTRGTAHRSTAAPDMRNASSPPPQQPAPDVRSHRPLDSLVLVYPLHWPAAAAQWIRLPRAQTAVMLPSRRPPSDRHRRRRKTSQPRRQGAEGKRRWKEGKRWERDSEREGTRNGELWHLCNATESERSMCESSDSVLVRERAPESSPPTMLSALCPCFQFCFLHCPLSLITATRVSHRSRGVFIE